MPSASLYANNIDYYNYNPMEIDFNNLQELEYDTETGEYFVEAVVSCNEDSLHRYCGLGQMTSKISFTSSNKVTMSVKNTGPTTLNNIMVNLFINNKIDRPRIVNMTFSLSSGTTTKSDYTLNSEPFKSAAAFFYSTCKCGAMLTAEVQVYNHYL